MMQVEETPPPSRMLTLPTGLTTPLWKPLRRTQSNDQFLSVGLTSCFARRCLAPNRRKHVERLQFQRAEVGDDGAAVKALQRAHCVAIVDLFAGGVAVGGNVPRLRVRRHGVTPESGKPEVFGYSSASRGRAAEHRQVCYFGIRPGLQLWAIQGSNL